MADALEGLVAHPLAVVADVVGEAGGAAPLRALDAAGVGIDGGLACDFRRQFDERFVNEDGDGI